MTFVDLISSKYNIINTFAKADKQHIQMTSIQYKITTTHSICSKFILGYSYKMLKIYLKIKPGK